jgi:hypothetical protein
LSNRNYGAAFSLAGLVLLAACQTGNTPSSTSQAESVPEGAVRESELRAYCPPVSLQQETAVFTTYERGGEGDPDRIVYRTAISDGSRACSYGDGAGTITAAIAGRVIPGPRGRTGTVTLPIRVEATRGDDVLYSKTFQHPVTISDTAGATQFLFTDPGIVIPGGIDRSVRLTIGFARSR